MKRTLLALTLLTGCAYFSDAQISSGGLPLSLTSADAALSNQYYSPVTYTAPDLEQIMAEQAKPSRSALKPYYAGVLAETNISFPQSGTLVTLADGRSIWRAQVQMGDVPSLIFYYDQFALPGGVKLFLSNANGKQILGAFTQDNNSDDGLFVTQEVQGGTVNLEMDIEAGVDLDAIKLHINRAGVMFHATNGLAKYAGNEDNGTAAKPTGDPIAGNSSVCEVNAICPAGQNYPEQRKATVRIIMPMGGGFIGFCTGTMINTTKGDCTPYLLTATHCESSNSKNNITFAQWLFYFNFEAPDCAGAGEAPNNQTLAGASFVSRADYNDNVPYIYGDFLLLKLNSKVPASFGAYFAGWNRATALPSSSLYVNFHHPAGDMKKLAVTNNIAPNGTFNQWNVPNTHWGVTFTTGGNEGGSSGSALFDINGRIVGDLSGGSEQQSCAADTNSFGEEAILGKDAVYSKLSRNWEYPEGNGALTAQLKPWLDPTNTGAMTTNSLAAAATCNAPTTGITNRNAELDNSVSVFPNPVVNGTLRLKVNLDKATDLQVAIYDITGARKATYQLKGAYSGEYTFDMSSYANGAYLVAVSNGSATTSKKIMLNR